MRLSTIRKNARIVNGQIRRPVKVEIKRGLRVARPGYTAGELATVSLMTEKLKRGEDLRTEKVAAARAAFVAGELDEVLTAGLKLDVAIDRMLEDVL